CFFVSSRRRHTRCYRDWSSDVCSSDLTPTGDWSVTEGNRTGGVAATMYPAKYTFNVNANPDCTNDFAAFAVNQPGLGVAASQTRSEERRVGKAGRNMQPRDAQQKKDDN